MSILPSNIREFLEQVAGGNSEYDAISARANELLQEFSNQEIASVEREIRIAANGEHVPYFSSDDCVEIFYVLGDDELMEKIGPDGGLLAAGEVELTDDEIDTIRCALQTKLSAINDGFYGRDRETQEWSSHLSAILEEIA